MGWHLPGWLKAILEGGYEPQADEDKLYALADQYDLCKKYLTEALPGRIDTAARGFGAAYHGEAGAALEDFLKRYARTKDFQGPAMLADSVGYVAEFLRTMGDTVVRTKRELLIIGIVSWITILAGVGPILGTLIRKIGQEGVKQLLLMMLKKLVNREARKLQQKMLLEMLTAGTKQTTKFVFSREMVPKVLGVVGGELADELIPHTVAGWMGELTGQDRRLAVGSDGQPQLDSQQRFVMTHDWDWRGTAMTAAGAVVGVPLSHGLGIGLAKVPVGKLARTFGNNAITSPLASSLTSLGFGEGWHTPSLQDAWIAGAHGVARGSMASDVHGPLESIGEAAGEYAGHKLVSALPGGHPPAGPDGGVLQAPPVNHETMADLSQETASGLAHNSAANLGQNAAQNSSHAASQVAASAGTVGQSAVAPLTSTTPWTAAGRASAQAGGTSSISQQSRATQEQTLRDPAGRSRPPADNGPDDNTDHEATEGTDSMVSSPSTPSVQPDPSTPGSRSSASSLPADPSVPGSTPAQTAQSAGADPQTAASSSPDTSSPQPPVALAQSAPIAQAPPSIDASPVPAAQATAAPPPVVPVAPPTARTSTNGSGASFVRGGAPELHPAGPSRRSRVGRVFAGQQRGGVHPKLPGGRERAFVADDNHLLYGDRAVSPHELATLARGTNPEIVVDQPSAAATAMAQKLADITGQDVVLRSSDGTAVLAPAEDRTVRPDGVVVPEGGKLVRKPHVSSAEGIEVEVDESKLGPRLGAGRSKTAFAFYDKVVLIAHPGVSLATEIELTSKLRALPGGGDVIAPIHARTTLFGRDAIVVDRFEVSSHAILDEEAPDADSRVTHPGLPTRATVDSLRALRTFALENHVLPGDLQFAITRDGRFRAYDVAGTRPVTGPKDPALTTLDAWLEWAEAQRETSTPDASTPDASTPDDSMPGSSARNAATRPAAPGKSSLGIIRRRSSGGDGSARARVRGSSDGRDRGVSRPRESEVLPAALRSAPADQALSAAEQSRIREAVLRVAGGDPQVQDGGMTTDAVRRALDPVRRRMRLPRGIMLRFVVAADNDELVGEYGIERTNKSRPGYFRMEDGIGVVYLSARDHVSPADVAATVWHEVIGHFAWHLFGARTRSDILDAVHKLRPLLPELSAEIDELYAGEPDDVRDEEFLARFAEDAVPPRVVRAFNALLSTRIGAALAHIGAISNETLENGRRKNELAPLYRILRVLVRAVRDNRPAVDGAGAPRARLAREHRDQPRGSAGSIHRSEFRGDGRGTPDKAAVRDAVHRALPQIASAVATAHDEVRAIEISGQQITITLRGGAELTVRLDVSGTFTDAGPVRWERTARDGDWALITLSPQVTDGVTGRAVAHALAGVVSAYKGEPSDGRHAEVGYLLDQIERGESPYHLRKELRLLLHHLGKQDGPPLPSDLRRRVEAVLHLNAVRTRVANAVVSWVDAQEVKATRPGLLGTKKLPSGAGTKDAPDPAVDRCLHRLFQHFANQPDVSAAPGESASRQKTLREQPFLRALVEAHGTNAAAALGRLASDQFTPAPDDQHTVAGMFDRLRGLVDQWRNAGSWPQRRRAARQFAEMADALGVIAHDDLRAALPHDLATSVAEIEPGLLQRMRRFAGQWLPDLPAELCFTLVETMPASAFTAWFFAAQDPGPLATTIFLGGAIAVPLRAALNRYVAVLEDLVITARRNYRQEQAERSQAVQRAELTDAVRTAGRQVLAAAAEHNGLAIPPDQPGPPRPQLTPPVVDAPPLVMPWWTFTVQSSVTVAVAAAPIALLVSPVVAGAGIGLAAVVFGTAQYAFARHQATLDDERRIRFFDWRGRRQLIGELRRAADELVRLQALGAQFGDPAIKLPSFAVAPSPDDPGRGVVPGKVTFAVRELLLSVVPVVSRAASVATNDQLAAATATLLEAVARVGLTSVVAGFVDALHAEANRHAFDRRMHNWLELLRAEVQTRAEKIGDPVLDQLDALLADRPLGAIDIPPLRPWSPVIHPEREATTSRRWYAVGAASIAGAGVGLSAVMVFRFHVDPSYLVLASIAAGSQPFSYYAKYLRRRMGVRADFDERDRAAERRAAAHLDRERAAAAAAAHSATRLEDVVNGLPPRDRPAPTTELGRFIESERRDGHPSTELGRLLARLEDLDAEHQRVLNRYDTHQPTELSQLTEILLAISSTLSEYADASHELGIDPHLRLGGPMNIPVSASVLHHDPLNGRNLTDQTWDANRPIRPSAEAERAALIAAKIQQVTENWYGPYSLAQIQQAARTGDQLVDIAAGLVATAERRRGPLWSRGPRAIAAKADFRRSLVADQARAVPARLINPN
ncbi:hypothetical protein [Kribbella sp. NPDC004875]|uniref:hypothetical protein n=1 Tax=Kribbella sp. NPDC004875 TaxID=3364107 RepID=UPI003684DA3E